MELGLVDLSNETILVLESNQYLLANTEFSVNAFIKEIQIFASKSGLIKIDVRYIRISFFNSPE
jgi:hypothetical protein